jgi:hypothetical protein
MELSSKHHMSCGVAKYGRGEVHCICPGREAKIHAAAVRGCVGTGDGRVWDGWCNYVRVGGVYVFKYMHNGRILHIVPADPAQRCTADEALPEVRRG